MSYQSLPHEIWESILKRLDFISIVKCMRVCKEIYQVIHSSPTLNYLIELGVAGYIDNPSYIASSAHRISHLTERNRYWKEMTWSDRYTLELKGDYYSQNPKRVRFSRGTILRNGILENLNKGKRTYELTPIRTFKSRITHSPLPFSIDFNQTVLGVDIGQDLLILLAVEDRPGMKVQFMHLGTMLPHPAAAVPELTLPDATLAVPNVMQILNNVCSTLVYSGNATTNLGHVIEVFDWKRGESLLKIYRPTHLLSGFRLLSPSHYIIISQQNPRIEFEGYAIQVRTLEGNQLIATYNLPAFAPRSEVGSVTCQAETTSQLDGDSTLPFQSSFISAPYPKMLLFNFTLSQGPSLDLVVLSTCFLPTPNQLEPWPNNVIPWSAWGERNTRLFVNASFGPSVHMFRICTADSVMDFNPIDIARDICRGNDKAIQQQSTVLPKSMGLFKDDLITRLPYRVVNHRIPTDELERPIFLLDDCILVLEGEDLKNVHSFL